MPSTAFIDQMCCDLVWLNILFLLYTLSIILYSELVIDVAMETQ